MKAERTRVPRAARWVLPAVLLCTCMASAHAREAPDVQALRDKADRHGMVPLIVQVKADFIPEGHMRHAAEVAQQRSAIARAQAAALRHLPAGGASVKYVYETTPFIALSANAEGIAAIARSPHVIGFHEDKPVRLALAQSRPLVGATRAAAMGFTGSGKTVAILDTGVDRGHDYLAGKVVSEACYSTTDSQFSSLCPGGVASSTAPGSADNCSIFVSSGCFHGTHVAGIVAANGYWIKGVAVDASLISIQVFSLRKSDHELLAYFSDVKRGLDRVAELRASFDIAAVNLSLGTDETYGQATASVYVGPSMPCDASYADIASSINQLKSLNIATVVASGNSSSSTGLSAPACIENAISVGNTTKSDAINTTSNSADNLDLLAPGTSIVSTLPGDELGSATGTSMAAPHVAGAWAILHQMTQPVDSVLARLVQTGVPITDARNGVTKPRIAVDQALLVEDANPNSYSFVDVSFVVRNTLQTSNTITVTGTNASSSVSVSGGSYSKNGGPFTTDMGTAVSGDTIRVQHMSANAASTSTSTTLTVGSVSDTFTSTTEPVLASFSVYGQSVTEGSPGNTTVTVMVNLSAAAGDMVTVPYSIGGTAVNPADHNASGGSVTVLAGQTSAPITFTVVGDALDEAAETVVLTMGTPTNASRVPDSFAFHDLWPVEPQTTQYSNTIAVSGTDATVKVTVTGGSYSKNGGSYTSSPGSAVAGDTFRLRHTSGHYSAQVITTLTIGGVAGSFATITKDEPLCQGCIPP
jgi:subtilisin